MQNLNVVETKRNKQKNTIQYLSVLFNKEKKKNIPD